MTRRPVEGLALAGLHRNRLAIGRDHFNRRVHARRNRHGVILFAEIDDHLLDLVHRGHLAEVIGVSHHTIGRGRPDQEGVGLVRIAAQFQRAAAEQRAGQELAIFEILKVLTRRFAVVLLHAVRIGNSCEPLLRL